MNGYLTFNWLYNLFFVLSFWVLTYATNIYIVFALALLFCLFLSGEKEHRKMLYLYVALAGCLSVFYFVIHGGGAAYRIFKTLTLIWLTLLIPIIQGQKITKMLHYFMVINALLVYVDVVLYNTIGFSFTRGVDTYGYMRFSGMIEDSNFFSYMLFCYVYYRKIETGKYDFFLIGAILLSFSLSLISTMAVVFLLLSLRRLWLLPSRYIKAWGGILIVFVFVVYYGLLFVLNSFRNVDAQNDYFAEKLVSLSLRFESQLEAFDALSVDNAYWWGIGAGKAREITTKAMNLHNSYLQILLEMGLVCLLLVVAQVAYCYRYLDKRFVLLFVVMILLGNVLEVFYFPLLSFIFFLSFVYSENRKVVMNIL